MNVRPQEIDNDVVWNLAIGSNMDINKLLTRAPKGRRPIAPLCPGLPATVKNWHLSFDFLFLPPAEPVMAAAMPCPDGELHGILYKLARDDYHTLCMSEGCSSPVSLYKEAVVEAIVYPSVFEASREHLDGNSIVKAIVFTLREPPRRSLLPMGLYPSRRYLNLMITGSVSAGLSSAYTKKLQSIPAARPVAGRMRGYARFMTMGIFFAYRSQFVMLLVRKSYRPFLAAVHCRREKMLESGRAIPYFLLSIFLVLIMFPFAAVGFVRALAQRQDIAKIARGDF